jgi:hypothetical protein
VCVNPTQVCVDPTQVCVNPTQVCVNPTQVCVDPTQVCVDPTQCVLTLRSDAALKPTMLLCHLDVSPIEPGTEAKWTHPPFSGAVDEEFVWGAPSAPYLNAKLTTFFRLRLIKKAIYPSHGVLSPYMLK